MKSRDNSIHDRPEMSALVSTVGIVGVWEGRYSFSLNMGGDGMINATERFTFWNDGRAEYLHEDNSGIQEASVEQYRYKTEGDRLILITDIEVSVERFEIEADRLILTDDQYNSREEYVYQPIDELSIQKQ